MSCYRVEMVLPTALFGIALFGIACSDGNETKNPEFNQVAADAEVKGPDAEVKGPDAEVKGEESPLLIQTRNGPVRGMIADSSRVFRGIRYAAAPVGPLRFAAPQPPEPWKKAPKQVATACPQLDSNGSVVGNEDCLTLDVWTPVYESSRPLPVMVWIHGGGFTTGSGYLFDALLPTREVIVVAISYRLGPLGFLAHPELTDEGGGTSGNYGIEDQQLALQWVRDNIRAFGGDPKMVTIFGESAGGISVSEHLVSKRSAGLFHRAIIESGTGFSRRPYTLAQSETRGLSFTAAVSCGKSPGAIECLREVPVEKLLNASSSSAVWAPSVDGVIFERAPLEMIADGSYNRVPIIVGSNALEGLGFVADQSDLTEDQYLAFINSNPLYSTYSDDLLSIYPATKFDSPQLALAAVVGNYLFNCPARRAVRALSEAGSDVYLYYYAQGTALHGSELNLLFGIGVLPSDQKVSGAIKDYWTEFAKTGNPNTGALPTWPRYQADTDQHLTLADPIKAGSQLLREECDFWDKFE